MFPDDYIESKPIKDFDPWEGSSLEVPEVEIEYQEKNDDNDCGDACRI